jgi:hypothetical protein
VLAPVRARKRRYISRMSLEGRVRSSQLSPDVGMHTVDVTLT